MDLLARIASVVIGIDAVLTFYTAILHLNRRIINSSIKFRIIRDLIVGIQTLQLYFITKGWHLDHPYLLYPFITLLFISGTLSYIRYFMFLYPGGKIPFRLAVQLVPAAVLLAWETWFYFINLDKGQAEIRSLFADPTSHLILLVIVAGVLVQLLQFVLLLRLELGFIKETKTRNPVLLSSGMMVLYMLDIVLMTAGFMLVRPALMNLGILLMGLTGITYLLFENRYPYFYQLVVQEERQKKYRKSLIQGLSREAILARLQELMEIEKLYRQLDLKLEDVAALLFITPHQLSEFLNEQLGMNFPTFVNRYRVEEAKQLLLQSPHQSTLSIAFEVGFGSKPSFNTIFKQQTGMTPSEFRKRGSDL